MTNAKQLPVMVLEPQLGLPCGGRAICKTDVDGLVWVNVNVMGNHWPIAYREDLCYEITADEAPKMGLCPECLGFGTTDKLPDDHELDPWTFFDNPGPCPTCGGSGRPCARVSASGDGDGVTAEVSVTPHGYTRVRGGRKVCAACGCPKGSRLHTQLN